MSFWRFKDACNCSLYRLGSRTLYLWFAIGSQTVEVEKLAHIADFLLQWICTMIYILELE